MNAATERRLTLPLIALVVLLAAVLLTLLGGLGRDVQWNPPRPAAAAANTPASAARLPPPTPLARYAEVWQKPLFSPDRKPSAHAAGGTSNIGELQLTGIILTPQLRMALLRNANGGQEIRVREGSALPDGSSTLVELQPRAAVFDSSSGRTELKLPAGAPIDLPRGDELGAPPPGSPATEAGPPGRDNGSGLSGEPEDESENQPNTWTSNADEGAGAKPEAAPPPRTSLLPAAPRTSPPPQGDARHLQDARVRQLRDAIRKRRAEQAAPATHEGDR